jgi:lauroyl/myristoyl acyltransferase
VLLPLRLLARLLPLLPLRVVLVFSDAIAFLVWAFDARGRRAGKQGLEAVFGAEMPPGERRRTLRASYRNAIQAEVLLFHLGDLTPERYARFVRIDPEDDVRFRRLTAENPSFVVASGHFGNWEMLLAARHLLEYVPPIAYLAETTGNAAVDQFIGALRDRGAGGGALRKGGAMALRRALENGQCASLLADRNVPGRYGGVWVPFLGLPARTTPLPAMLAHWYRVPLAVVLLLPEGRARWRLWVSGNLMEPRTGDEAVDVPRALARMNDVFSRAIREHPAAWAWMLKRWKSRPTPELGPYPAYSVLDEDPAKGGARPAGAAPVN